MRLSRSDLEGALDFLCEAGDVDGADPFPREVLERLAVLVRCQNVSYAELDRARGKVIFAVGTCDESPSPDQQAAYWATAHEHPIRRHRTRTGQLGAFKIFDFVTRKELGRTQFHADYLRHSAAAKGFLMTVSLRAPSQTTRTFLLDRESADFDERERSLLNMLQPHLLHLRNATDVRRRAQATMLEMPEGVLTKREGDVLALVAEGMRNREIAEALWIAPGTVRKHLDNIYAKLDVQGRVAAVARMRNGGGPS